MGQDFEFRDDPKRADGAAQCPVQLCPVKWQAAKAAMDLVRGLGTGGVLFSNSRARQIARLLDQAGLTPDFEPSRIDQTLQDAAA